MSVTRILLPASLLLVCASGCKSPFPYYCDTETPCTADPDRPYCDIDGEVGGVGRTCIPWPFAEPPCASANDCPSDAPVCDLYCRGCADSTECEGLSGAGDLCRADGQCVSCLGEADCGTHGCNLGTGRCNECAPGTSTCAGGEQIICDGDGLVASVNTCSLGCHEGGTRCWDIEPSNGLGQYLDLAEGGPDLTFTDGSVIDTDQGSVLIGGNLVAVPNELVPAPEGGVDIRVFRVRSLSVSGNLTISGNPAVAFVSHEAISIQGHIRIEAGSAEDGYGSDGDVITGCGGGGCSPDTLQSCSGGGGGGFGGRGGNGGAAGGSAGGSGGAIVGNTELSPLRGGSHGWGRGGGAVQLVSRESIAITSGAIDAGGRAGTSFLSGTGGGSGGGILLEAPTVLVSGQGTSLAANGGGGGCAGDVTSPAEDGRLDGQRAAGCVSADGGDGGSGGAGTSRDGAVGSSANANCSPSPPVHGGGGGGGAGRIRVNTASGSFAPAAGAIVSPFVSVGAIELR